MSTATRCPKCRRNSLKEVEIPDGRVKLDSCPRCKGAWFDAGELRALMGAAVKELAAPSDAKKTRLSCPKCHDPLYRFYYFQTYVNVDVCKRCGGFWLDVGEFTEIEVVREALKKEGRLKEYAPSARMKGAMLRFLGIAAEALSFW